VAEPTGFAVLNLEARRQYFQARKHLGGDHPKISGIVGIGSLADVVDGTGWTFDRF
jgi:hypothetical protein